MRSAPDNLTQTIRQIAESMGYELVGIELLSRQKQGTLLRIYIDSDKGITLDDCTSVSHQVSGLLDVENPIEENYDLEVSSPGIDRPLFDREHFERFRGKKARIRMRIRQNGRRRYDGILMGIKGDDVTLDIEGEKFNLPLDQIESARLIPEF
ncbi:MAG: ribosome maturation factor RimP [Candidatus Polarisedimenticolaceae bacterium]|nr:ribosome maturation factor RimP [Candidatus Polarisedimenticolaceae bacterium]